MLWIVLRGCSAASICPCYRSCLRPRLAYPRVRKLTPTECCLSVVGKYERKPRTNNWHSVEDTVQSDSKATWSNEANREWTIEVSKGKLVAPNSPYGRQEMRAEFDATGRKIIKLYFQNQAYNRQ